MGENKDLYFKNGKLEVDFIDAEKIMNGGDLSGDGIGRIGWIESGK